MLWVERSIDGGACWYRYKRMPAPTALLLKSCFPHIYRVAR